MEGARDRPRQTRELGRYRTVLLIHRSHSTPLLSSSRSALGSDSLRGNHMEDQELISSAQRNLLASNNFLDFLVAKILENIGKYG
ncbi:hypothetical protein J6590_063877 [Homalodisca vitripennis]|nr:hypothetical protein J6590_063877 [Homalodisca vitripennis]